MIDFDVILGHLGGFGLYQIMLVFMVCYYSIPSGMISLSPVFTNYRPNYRQEKLNKCSLFYVYKFCKKLAEGT